MNLNEKSIHDCYAFELVIVVRNLREDGMRGSTGRVAAAEEELERRARADDPKAIRALEELAAERMGAS